MKVKAHFSSRCLHFFSTCFYFSVHTNMLIAVAAMAQCALSYLIFKSAISYPIILLEGSATLLLYNFSLYLAKPADPMRSPYKRTRWVFSHLPIMYFFSALAAIIFFYSFLNIGWMSRFFLAFTGLCSFSYSFPLYKQEGRWVGLRQLPTAKIFHIAAVWVLSSVCLPYVDLYSQGIIVDPYLLGTLMLLKFLFLLICTLPFDIRDLKQDSYYHLKTIPTLLGANKAKRLCYLLLITHSIALIFTSYGFAIQGGLWLTNLFIFGLLKGVIFKSQAHYHYAYLLDFAMIVQYALVFFISFFYG